MSERIAYAYALNIFRAIISRLYTSCINNYFNILKSI